AWSTPRTTRNGGLASATRIQAAAPRSGGPRCPSLQQLFYLLFSLHSLPRQSRGANSDGLDHDNYSGFEQSVLAPILAASPGVGSSWFYVSRTAGRYRDHWHFGGALAAGYPVRSRSSPAHAVHEQYLSIGKGRPEL